MSQKEVQTLALAIVASLGLHLGAGVVLARARFRSTAARDLVEVEVKTPPPPPAVPVPPPPPEPDPPPPKPVRLARKAAPPPDLAPPKRDEPPPPPREVVPRVFGADLSGETTGDIALPPGNTLDADPNRPRPKVVPTAPPTTGPAAPPGRAGFAPVDEGEIASFPEVADEVKAPYPAEAEARQVEGTVQVRVEINADGTVHSARVLKGLGFGLDEAAVRALKRFRFKPARDRAGRGVPCVIVWRYTFQLDR